MPPKPTSPTAVGSIWSRPLDLLWTAWFGIHILVMLFVDLNPLWPLSIKPQFMTDLRNWYMVAYHDPFFISPPAWFTLYMWLEAVYHVPLSIWAVGALIRGDPLVPAHLLIWAVQTGVTTLTCIVEYMAWKGVTNEERTALHGLYGPYFAISVIIGLDMFLRIRRVLVANGKTKTS